MLPKLKEENLQATQAEQQKKHGRDFDPRTFDPRTMKRIVLAFYPYRSELVTILAGILLAALLGLVPSLLISHLIDDAIGQGHASLLLIYVAFMAGALILAGLFGVGQSYLSARLGQNMMYDFRNKFYQHLQCMPLSFFTETRTGEIQSRLTNDISEIQGTVTNTVATRLLDIIIIVSTIITMLVISPLMTLITLALLPLFVWTTYKVSQSQRRMNKESRQSMASLTAQMEETLSASRILLLKVLGQQKYAQAQFQQENKTLTNLTLRQLLMGRVLFTITYTFYSLLPVIIYLIAGEQIIQHLPLLGGNMTLGTMIAFITLQVRLFFPLGDLASLRMEIQGALALFDRIFEYLDLPIPITDKPDALQLTPEMVNGEVTFRNVTFTYKRDEYDAPTGLNAFPLDSSGSGGYTFPLVGTGLAPVRRRESMSFLDPLEGGQGWPLSAEIDLQEEPRPTLHNISFTIKPGQLVALVGPGGAGKTTITYMLPRLYDVDSGEVEIDGINVKDIAQASLSELIGVITQETYLFHASIRENLLSARPDATEEEMIAAAQIVAIHDRITELYSGYNTIVGGTGYEPSDDEKQRMTIARILLKNPRILILDKPTSTLDTHAERLIQTALETLIRGRTTLAIAHHLSTLLAADLILVVNKGEIVERGTHQQLLALNGLYAQLYHEQFSQASTGITHDITGTLPKTTADTFHSTTSIYHDVTENFPKTTAGALDNATSIYHDVTEKFAKTTAGTFRDTSGTTHETPGTPRDTSGMPHDTPATTRDTSGMPHDITSTLPKPTVVVIRDTPGTLPDTSGTTHETPETHETVGTRTGASPVPTASVHETAPASETPTANIQSSEVTMPKETISASETPTANVQPLEVAMPKGTIPASETPTANVQSLEVTMQKKAVPPTPTPKLPIRVATQNDIFSTSYLPPSIRGIFTPITQNEQAPPAEADTKETP